jgi:hypothetical protein
MTKDVRQSAGPPEFSFIVPLYNTEPYVEKCLRSILGQTMSSLELIVVDDGSTDNSALICRQVAEADSRVRLVQRRNGGAGSARNAGVQLATGKYIGFVDSDDWIEDNFCTATSALMEDGADFVSIGLDFVNEGGTTIKTVNGYTVENLAGREIFLSALTDTNVLSSPVCKVYRRDLLQGNGICFPDIRAFEDSFFSRAVARAAKTARFDRRVLYHALERRDSMTRALTVEKFACASQLFELERSAFSEELRDPQTALLFDAHIVKFMAFLLFLAAFRIDNDGEFRRCRSLAAATGFEALARDRRVMRHLPRRVRLAASLALRPRLLRPLVRAAKRLGFSPY